MEGGGGEASVGEDTVEVAVRQETGTRSALDETEHEDRPETPISREIEVASGAEPQTPHRRIRRDSQMTHSPGLEEPFTPASTASRIGSTPRSTWHTTATITTPSTARTGLTDISSEKSDKVPAYRREAPSFSHEDDSVRRQLCLQCAIVGLECDMAWPSCSRCLRRQNTVTARPVTSAFEERKLLEPCLARRRLLFEERSDVFSAGIYYTNESVLARFVDDDPEMWAEKLALEHASLERLLGPGRESWSRSGMRYLSTFAMFNYPPHRSGLEDKRPMLKGISAFRYAPRRPVNDMEITPAKLKSTMVSDRQGPRADPFLRI